jgi:hypothetical protein
MNSNYIAYGALAIGEKGMELVKRESNLPLENTLGFFTSVVICLYVPH